jgi:hypothetical protein
MEPANTSLGVAARRRPRFQFTLRHVLAAIAVAAIGICLGRKMGRSSFHNPEVQSIITTWPVVSTAQNGSGIADSRSMLLDAYANPVWLKNEQGFIFYRDFDVTIGAFLTRR